MKNIFSIMLLEFRKIIFDKLAITIKFIIDRLNKFDEIPIKDNITHINIL